MASARRAYSSSAPRQDRVQRPRRPGLACAGAVALGVQAGRKRQQEGRLAASLARLLGRGSGPSPFDSRHVDAPGKERQGRPQPARSMMY